MPRRPPAYPVAYREQAIRHWVFQDEADRGERPEALTTHERAELPRLRRENRQLQGERDLPGTAAAWFARESGTILPASSSS